MAKKRNPFEKTRISRKRTFTIEKNDRRQNDKWENLVLNLLYSSINPLPLTIIETTLLEQGGKKKELKTTVESLLQAGLIKKDGKRLFKISTKAPLYEGLLAQHPKGFGFITLDRQLAKDNQLLRDPFVSPANMGLAQHGDRVLIRVQRVRKDDRPEAVVLKILSPGTNKIAGVIKIQSHGAMVFPDDPRFPFTIKIDDFHGLTPADGDAVIVQFIRENHPTRLLSGSILEILGPLDAIDTQFKLVVEKFDLPTQFSSESLEEVANLADICEPGPFREDLRDTDHITIDGETAKDFDDAICVIKNRRGFRLYVSIADVSHFVVEGSSIDHEAYARGTSIYFPGRVIPMLPERLSNDLCSLVPGKDRLTVSAILDFDRSGKLQKKAFARSIIRSRQRFTYTTVRKILTDKDLTARREHKDFLTHLKWAEELATALRIRRRKRGSIDFNLPEPEFVLSETGGVTSIGRAERNFAHQLIEEFMLAANEAVATLFTEKKVSALYRVHEPPDPAKTEEFFAFSKTLGLHLAPMNPTSAWFAEVLDQCQGTRYEYIINNLLLRSMKQAQYAADNVGHFGLASADYTHFTSPIRRFPDLIVHRKLLGLINKSMQKQNDAQMIAMQTAGEFLSTRERTAIMAERDMQERLKVLFMKDHVGESFDAIISGVNDSALFIEIPQYCLSGSVGIDRLDDDYYLLDHKNHRLFGEITANTYRIGDPLRVTLLDVDTARKRLNFTPALPAESKQKSNEGSKR